MAIGSLCLLVTGWPLREQSTVDLEPGLILFRRSWIGTLLAVRLRTDCHGLSAPYPG